LFTTSGKGKNFHLLGLGVHGKPNKPPPLLVVGESGAGNESHPLGPRPPSIKWAMTPANPPVAPKPHYSFWVVGVILFSVSTVAISRTHNPWLVGYCLNTKNPDCSLPRLGGVLLGGIQKGVVPYFLSVTQPLAETKTNPNKPPAT